MEEFLIDSDFEFVKIKNMLERSPKALKEDPILGVDYIRVINLIKKKKLLERTTDLYDPTASAQAHYFDMDKVQRQNEIQFQEKIDGGIKEMIEKEQNSVPQDLVNYDAEVTNDVKTKKKDEAKK
mmetsp:Transcript_14210/g.24163  ORF Transcript_14210/g.24163 Transcript_14210/m.24163 type:complete len:125 (+) Transcript_14210:784-1158(+)